MDVHFSDKASLVNGFKAKHPLSDIWRWPPRFSEKKMCTPLLTWAWAHSNVVFHWHFWQFPNFQFFQSQAPFSISEDCQSTGLALWHQSVKNFPHKILSSLAVYQLIFLVCSIMNCLWLNLFPCSFWPNSFTSF